MIQYYQTKTGHLLPAIHDGSEYRFLGRTVNPNANRNFQAFGDYLQATANPVLDLNTLAPYDRFQSNVPILNQGQVGDCTPHGTTSAFLKCRDLEGLSFEALSAASLYAQIDNNQDNGSDLADAVQAITNPGGGGICLLSDVPDNFVLWNNINATAKQNALRFRIVSKAVYQCANFAELVTADYLGFATILTINVGNNFNNLDSDGVVPFAPGIANHCVSGGEGFGKTSNGTSKYRFRNSWGNWGQNGCAWLTSQHIDNQPAVQLFAMMWVLQDPNNAGDNLPILS